MKEYSCKHNLKVKIPNKTYSSQKMTNLGAFTKTSSGYMAIKDHKPGGCMMITVNNKFKIGKYYPVKKGGKLVHCAHANSITRVGSTYYIATMNSPSAGPAILKVNGKGVVQTEYYLYSTTGAKMSTTAIDYYGKVNGLHYFIVKTGYTYNANRSKKAVYFDVVKLESGRFTSTGIRLTTDGYIPAEYVDNDITYDATNKRIYSAYFVKEANEDIKKSFVYAYDLDNVSHSHQLKTNRRWATTAYKKDGGKFEIEAFLVYKKKKYIVANANNGRDGIFELINK